MGMDMFHMFHEVVNLSCHPSQCEMIKFSGKTQECEKQRKTTGLGHHYFRTHLHKAERTLLTIFYLLGNHQIGSPHIGLEQVGRRSREFGDRISGVGWHLGQQVLARLDS